MARQKTRKKSGSRFRNVGEDIYSGTGTHEDGREMRKGGKNGSRIKTRRVRKYKNVKNSRTSKSY